MTSVVIVLLILMFCLLVVIGGIALFSLISNRQMLNRLDVPQEKDQSLELVQNQLNAFREEMQKQLSGMNKQLLDTTGQIGKRLGNVHKGLGELGQASKQIYDLGKDISSLQDILQPPKLRGVLGEVFLKDLLCQVVPNHCDFQHAFKSGETVDAVIRIGDRLVPVDSKFPLENFRKVLDSGDDEKVKLKYKKDFLKDVKKHIDAIASKYILPDEGTYDFALMYVPAENVYYEIITKEQKETIDISDYAVQKRVIPVSPNSIYAYLQVVIYGLKGLQVEKHAEQIINHLARLRGDFTRFTDDFAVLGGHLGNAAKKYEDAEKKLVRFDDKLSLAEGATPSELPETEEGLSLTETSEQEMGPDRDSPIEQE